ncbi:unnamed protein product [Prorocentrum cordatum]|uniref:Mei2-like C-terminal RNA recognition motif domain-containing protein n=1 Tax=Prorocentrum cordatum TaxID=2364126 RepID=A0ABN9USJ4_9DINO|nr:unnamed protein product [Polarella glacialis]
MFGSPLSLPGPSTAHVGTAIPEQLGASWDGSTRRVLVQNTFIEVISEATEDHKDTNRRNRSAPAAVTTEQALEDFDSAFTISGHGKLDNGAIDCDFGDEGGGDRTTVVIRNLPPNYSRAFLLELLDAHGFAGKYDFVYLPLEFGSGTTFGFAFVNLTGPEHAAHFKTVFDGFSSWQVPCECEAAVGWSWSQGYQAHVDRYRNSPVMHDAMPDDCKPIVFAGGARAVFPPPTKRVPPLKRQRRRPAPSARGAAALAASAGDESSGPASNAEGGCSLSGRPGEGSLMRGALEAVDRGACERDLVGESPLASALCTYAGGRLGREDGRWKASPRRERPSGAREAREASWADLSEDLGCPAALQGLLLPGLCPTQELQARPPSAARAPRPEGPGAPGPGCHDEEADLHSESSTDVSSSHVLSQVVCQEHPHSAGQLSSGSTTADAAQRSDTARSGARRGRRAGRRGAKSHASAAPWTGGSILLPGLVSLGFRDAGPLTRISDDSDVS